MKKIIYSIVKISIFSLMIFISNIVFANATDYYISSSGGSDSNTGLTEGDAWASFDNVNSGTFNPGDSILLKRGDTFNDSINATIQGVDGNHITFSAYGDLANSLPIISPGTSNIAMSLSAEYITFEDIEITNASTGIYVDDTYGGLININNLEIHDVTGSSIMFEDRSNVAIDNVEIYNSGSYGIAVVTAHSSWGDILPASTLSITNSYIYDNVDDGILVNGHGAYIANNIMTHNGQLSDHSRHNIYLIGDDAIIENNQLTDSIGCGIRFYGSNTIIRNNFIDENHRQAIGFWSDITDGNYSGIKIYNNVLTSTSFGDDNGNTFGISIITNDGTFGDMEIYNNTIYSKADTRAIFAYDCNNVKVKNNIIKADDEAIYLGSACSSGFESDYNLFDTIISEPFTEQGGAWGAELTEWQGLGYDTNSITGDPLFKNPSGLLNQDSDFNISETSPAKDAGTTIVLVTDDYLDTSRPQGSGYDIGAFEYEEIDTVSPIISEVTLVPTPTSDTTPDYTFATDEAGTITYGGSCSSSTTNAVIGNNTVTFNTLADGTYTDCTITVTDESNNVSNTLTISTFEVNTTVTGTIYYVSSSGGSDSNDGLSEGAAWETFDNVNTGTFNPGDSILFKRGDTWNGTINMNYTSLSGADGNHITFGAYDTGADPVLSSSSSAVFNLDAQYITIENLEIANTNSAGIYIGGGAGDGLININNVVTHDNGNAGIFFEGRGNVEMDNVEVYNSAENAGIIIQKQASPSSWADLLPTSTISIINSNIHDNDVNGVYIAGHGAYIADSTFDGNGSSNTGHNIYIIGDDSIIENNDILNSERLGIRFYGSDNIFRNNFLLI